jgi:hypothetical protein
MKKIIATLAFGVFAVGAAPANATLSTFDFAGTAGNFGHSLVFNPTSGPGTLKVTAWTHSPAARSVFEADINRKNDALGVTRGPWWLFDNEELDNKQGNDFLAMDFGSSLWDPWSATITSAGSSRFLWYTIPEDDWQIWGSNNLEPGDGAPWLSGGNATLLEEGSGNGLTDISGARFQYIYISGEPAGSFNGNDDFRVSQVVGEIPEPGTLALFGIGLVGFGLARRRRKMTTA